MNHTYEITIQAADEKQAEIKMKAITVLASRLTAKELEKLADIVAHDPVKTAIAKKALGV